MSAVEEKAVEAVQKTTTMDETCVERSSATLLLATDACCQSGHDTAEVEHGGGEVPLLICVTCTELWGRMEGLQSWQEHCPCCFSEAHPHGLVDLGITAQLLSSHHQPAEQARSS
jgi:hypothetical protein